MKEYLAINEELYPIVENINKIYKKPKHPIKLTEYEVSNENQT